MRRLSVLCVVLALALGGAACSDDAEQEAGEVADDAEDAARDVADEAEDVARDAADRAEDMINDRTVNIDDNAYEPKDREVTRGTEVTWVNQDDVQHTVTDEDGAFESEELDEGDEFSHRFTEEGTYNYYCEVHGEDVMSGTVEVTS